MGYSRLAVETGGYKRLDALRFCRDAAWGVFMSPGATDVMGLAPQGVGGAFPKQPHPEQEKRQGQQGKKICAAKASFHHQFCGVVRVVPTGNCGPYCPFPDLFFALFSAANVQERIRIVA